MMLTEVAPVPDGALPVQAMKDHLRLGTGFSDDGMQDALIAGYLRAALAAVEGRIGKALIARRFSLALVRWRDRAAQALPLAPVGQVVSVTLVDGAGATALAGSRWRLEADMHRPRLVSVGALFPEVVEGGRAEVVFDAGFGAWDAVPADLRQAVLLRAAQYHELRHETAQAAMPFGVMALIERWRTVRVLGGGA
ncbi:head-tail connector protein [Gemmobacter nectariphilus]|uniref:head-tail connector protein n=1 Tax=Gemmobacter nectariphilus TaxID=220343 RepID=UPI0003FE2519|nr:hypothetical protein [Gemmobacter nectariphilus]